VDAVQRQKIFTSLPSSLESLINEKVQFKVALKNNFYSVEEFLKFKSKS
jgi:hypothetical protein